MLKNRLKILLRASAVITTGIFLWMAPPALAAAGYTNPSQPASDVASLACDNYSGAAKTACENCRADGTCIVCHPEYNFGQALTPEQLSSCQVCNKKTGLSFSTQTKTCLSKNPIVVRLNEIVNLLAGIASLVIIGVIIAGGIQYSMAGNPQAAAAARKRIINAMVALAAFIFIWAFLQWLIPGGL